MLSILHIKCEENTKNNELFACYGWIMNCCRIYFITFHGVQFGDIFSFNQMNTFCERCSASKRVHLAIQFCIFFSQSDNIQHFSPYFQLNISFGKKNVSKLSKWFLFNSKLIQWRHLLTCSNLISNEHSHWMTLHWTPYCHFMQKTKEFGSPHTQKCVRWQRKHEHDR